MDKLFFDLRATHNPHRWFMPVEPAICVGPPGNVFMFGGVGMASAVAALERTTGRPLICATAQYLGYGAYFAGAGVVALAAVPAIAMVADRR